MNRKYTLIMCIILMILMPILSIEDIVLWIVSLYFIHKSIKAYKLDYSNKVIIKNTIICTLITVIYNLIVSNIETILVKLWL